MTSRDYFGKMNSTLGSVVPLAMFTHKTDVMNVYYNVFFFVCILNVSDITLRCRTLIGVTFFE